VTRWTWLVAISWAVSIISSAFAEPRGMYTADEEGALWRGLVTAIIASLAHWLDWRKRSSAQRTQVAVLHSGLFWAFLVGGSAGGLLPFALERVGVSDFGGFAVWLEYTLSAGLGVAAGGIAAAFKSGIQGGVRQLLRYVAGIEEGKP
jgi:hypothetical protein